MNVVFTIHHHVGEKPWYQVYHGRVLKMSGTNLFDVPSGLERLVYEKMSKKEKSIIHVGDIPKFVPTINNIDPVGDCRITKVQVYTQVKGEDEGFDVVINDDHFSSGNCLLDVLSETECGVYSGTEIYKLVPGYVEEPETVKV
jgi:hypothetical protein